MSESLCAPATSPATARSKLSTGLVYSDRFKDHLRDVSHVESPDRLDAIMKVLGAPPFRESLVRIDPRPATEDELLLCHTRDYVASAKRDVESGRRMLRTGDTVITRDSYEVALLAAGGVMAAVDAVVGGKARNAFCAVRPPGHHATSTRGMGFCMFSNVAIAARYAQKKHGVETALIVDWDVHHGNGTQDVFWRDGSVFFMSTHQWPLYPGTGRADEIGEGRGKGCIMNCPFAAGAGRKEILGAFRDKLAPAADRFKPQLILISAGFDSRKGDPLGGFKLTDEDFTDLTKLMLSIAQAHAGGRVISVLEGGYSLEGVAAAAGAHMRAMM